MTLTMLDLFSGIGGFSLAADWTGGIETVAFCEIEPYCQKVLKKHWPDVPCYSDIKELNGYDLIDKYGRIDIVVGGFPCQPFSCAGKQLGKEDDRYLWPEMFRIIQETEPTWVVGENVAGLINLGLEDCFLKLETEGYEVQPLIIPACAVQAPHRRDRVWIVAYSESLRSRRRGNPGTERWERLVSYEQTRGQVGSEIERCGSLSRKDDVADPNGSGINKCSTGSNLAGELSKNCIESRDGWTSQNNRYGWWESEPSVGRVADGIPDRAHRLKCLGNSIVPQVAYQILQGIVDIEKEVNYARHGQDLRQLRQLAAAENKLFQAGRVHISAQGGGEVPRGKVYLMVLEAGHTRADSKQG